MSKLIAIAFSDLHIHEFTQYAKVYDGGINSRLFHSIGVLTYLGRLAQKANVPLLFSGDLFENQSVLSNRVGAAALHAYKIGVHDRKVKMYAVSGNHDLSERNGLDNYGPSHLQKFQIFDSFKLLDGRGSAAVNDDFIIQGIPYMDNDQDTLTLIKEYKEIPPEIKKTKGKKRILLLHQDLPGATTPAGYETKEYHSLGNRKTLEKLLAPWDFVLCGHIHKPQRILQNCWMVGSPIHQIASDEGTKMGYWEIYDELFPNFVSLNDKFPSFIALKKDQTPYNNKDYFIELPVDDLVEEEVKKKEFHINNSREQLATSYLKAKGIKSKSKSRALKLIFSQV